jgi:hypothetical protein
MNIAEKAFECLTWQKAAPKLKLTRLIGQPDGPAMKPFKDVARIGFPIIDPDRSLYNLLACKNGQKEVSSLIDKDAIVFTGW